jgi:NTP pyrophosphatase (non-canonical NTP hydrolase)
VTPKKEREYFDFVNQLGLQRANVSIRKDESHTEEMSFCLLHMVLGMVTESGEIADLLKKHMVYARPLDKTKLKDELGDLLFYLCGALIDLGSSLDEIIAMNMAKLKARYPNGYSHQSANNRNPDVENEAQRQVMNEGGVRKKRVKCAVCSGDGYLLTGCISIKCPQCNGTGYVEKKPISIAKDDRLGPCGTKTGTGA